MRHIVIVMMNVWVYSMVVLWTVLGGLICLPMIVVFCVVLFWSPRKVMRLFVWIYGWVCIRIFAVFAPFRNHRVSRDNLPKPGIVIMNHCSFFDTFFLPVTPLWNVCICLRSWPFRMFWYYLFMRLAGYLDIESSPWQKITDDAAKEFKKKNILMIFPEGHRSRDGKLGRFHSGAFKLAIEHDVPVFPLCIQGTYEMLPRTRWWLTPTVINYQLLEPIYPAQFEGVQGHVEMREFAKQTMADAIERMRTARQ